MKKLLSLVLFLLTLFSLNFVYSANKLPSEDTRYGRFVGEVKLDNSSKKTVFLLLDNQGHLVRVYSSKLASYIRDLFVKGAEIKIKGQTYYTNKGFFAGIFVKDIGSIERINKEDEWVQKKPAKLDDLDKIILYVYSKNSDSSKLNQVSGLIGGNNPSSIVSEVENRITSGDINSSLYKFIDNLFSDKELNINSNEYCDLKNGSTMFDNLNSDLKFFISSFDKSKINEILEGNLLDNDDKKFISGNINGFGILKKYVQLQANINSLDNQLSKNGSLINDISILSGISSIEMNFNKLKFLLDNKNYISDIFSIYSSISGVDEKTYTDYVVSKLKYFSLKEPYKNCSLLNNIDDKYVSKLNRDFEEINKVARSKDYITKIVDGIKLTYFVNFNVLKVDSNGTSYIRVFEGDYHNIFSFNVDIRSKSDIHEFETCQFNTAVRLSGYIGGKFTCTYNNDSKYRIGYAGEKVLLSIPVNDKYIDIYYYKNNNKLDDLLLDIFNKIEIINK